MARRTKTRRKQLTLSYVPIAHVDEAVTKLSKLLAEETKESKKGQCPQGDWPGR